MKLFTSILFLFFTTIIGCSIYGCSKDKETISIIPKIDFVSVSPSAVVQYQDSLVFRISYQDGDGDLGENVDSVRNVFLTDSRNNVTYKYRLQELAPSNTKIAITGFVNITLKSLALINPALVKETATYSIFIKDRAGNQSNTIVSSLVTINK